MTVLVLSAFCSLLSALPSMAHATCTGSGLVWNCTAVSTSANIQSAINSASDGATITLAAGNYTLSGLAGFSANAGVTIICATPGACTLNTSGSVFGVGGYSGTNTHFYRISGFTFNTNGNPPIWFGTSGPCAGTFTQIRIDHNTFNLPPGAVAVLLGGTVCTGEFYGVIDHNTVMGPEQAGIVEWLNAPATIPPASQQGTGNNLFVEDNTLNFTSVGSASALGCSDAWGVGVGLVFRHNTSTNCLWTTHGVTHGGGPSNVEFYENNVTMNSGSVGAGIQDCYRCFHHQGSGEFMAFNNVFTAFSGKSGEAISVAHYRDYANSIDGGMPMCDGTFNLDGNRPGTNGYPCWNQPGRDAATQNLVPMYVWNNTWSDTHGQVPLEVPDFGGSPNYHALHMQPDREWENAVSASAQTSPSSPFNGTTGMGFGTLANRPTSCTTFSEPGSGVGYFAMDDGPQGTLYRCSSSNKWSIQYKPFTYPHPLVSGTTPPPPPTSPAWSGILDPSRAMDWSQAGVQGGIPARTTTCSTVNAATYGNGSSDATPGIQNALNSCAPGATQESQARVLQLSAGTFRINGNLSIPSYVTLRGAGADQTILNAHGTSGDVVDLGNPSNYPNTAASASISAGATAGSNSITVSNASGISVGGYLMITELNDPSFVSINGSEGACTWCDGYPGWSGTRTRGQIVEVTSVTGTVLGISPALYSAYSHTPLATSLPAFTKYAGVENLQVYANNTGYGSNFGMSECANCWISGVEGNYADGNHVSVQYSYRGQIQNSYFSNAYIHGPGGYDSDITLYNKSSGMLVQNNILERLHVAIMLEWGAAGNVVAYNYTFGNYADGSTTFGPPGMNTHGAHPQFNLFEGNITQNLDLDSIWGSHSHNTVFRNWSKGTTKLCSTQGGGRAAVTCANDWAVQYVAAMRVDFLGSSYNLVGNVFGSQDMAHLTAYNFGGSPMTQVNQVVAVCGPSPCGPGSRSYDAAAYAYDLGFGEASDDGSSGFDSLVPYSTLFSHGNYSSPTGAITWSGSITHTLPASFYLSGRPSWFGSSPWPPIGPDVNNGLANAFSHANAIPAVTCYEQVMHGTDGTGSPLSFNASACYGTSTPPPPSACDINGDASTNVGDVQVEVNAILTPAQCTPPTMDLNQNAQCDVGDVQRIANVILGGSCVTGP